MAVSCKYGDEPTGSDATELVSSFVETMYVTAVISRTIVHLPDDMHEYGDTVE
jgi:hypothetical protein